MVVRSVLFVLAVATLVSCTASPKPVQRATTPPAAFARYFFTARHDRGVLEVTSSPSSICYWTQSYPARPIIILAHDNGASRPVATYQPETGTFCDREVGSDVASSLIEDSALFVVKWSPQAGEPVVESKLVAQGS